MNDRMTHGERLFSQGKIDQALTTFKKIIQDHPDNSQAYNNLGVIYFHLDQIESAIASFYQALNINPTYKCVIFNLSDIFKKQHQITLLQPILQKALLESPNDVDFVRLMQEISSHIANSDTDTISSNVSLPSFSESALNEKRILHCPFEIAGNMARITKHLKRNDINATSVNYYDSWLQYQCDTNLHINRHSSEKQQKIIAQFAVEAIEKYDIFHFHFSHSLYPDFRDLEEIKKRDKNIVFSFWGSDQRSPEWILYQQARFLGYEPPKPHFITLNQYHTHKLINRYADVMLGTTCIPRGVFIPGMVDAEEWCIKEKDKIIDKNKITKKPEITYFLHAPSNNWKKGSSIILNLFDELKTEGAPIELLHVNKLPPKKAKEIYAYADYAIDQVGIGTFGLFGLEMMCWEIPVLAYHIPLFDKMRNYPPAIPITKENFKRQMLRCVEMKKTGEIRTLQKQSRNWILKNADISSSISQYIQIYQNLVIGNAIKQHANKSWYDQEYKLQQGIKSNFYNYMIEHNVFQQLNQPIPEYDKRLYT